MSKEELIRKLELLKEAAENAANKEPLDVWEKFEQGKAEAYEAAIELAKQLD